jgi:hypothetical protein
MLGQVNRHQFQPIMFSQFGILFVFVITVLSTVLAQNPCLELCKTHTTLPYQVTYCSNQNEFILMNAAHRECYWKCNTTMLYAGSCECPNNCFSHLGAGVCHNKCHCNLGWKGSDCGSVKCPENTCSGHGSCVSSGALDFCRCDHGWTGPACESQIPQWQKQPYPIVYPNDRPYYSKTEKYKDDHPFFNISTIPSLRVEMTHGDWLKMLLPQNAYLNEWLAMNLTYQNDLQVYRVVGGGIRIKGASGRSSIGKNFKMRFPKGNRPYGVKTLALKNVGENGFGMRYVIPYEMHRAMNTPRQRSSFGMLYINNIKHSLFWLGEEVDDDFLKARYEDPTGNLYQGRAVSASLAFRSENPLDYKNYRVVRQGHPYVVYDQKEGLDESYRDLTTLVVVNNKSRSLENDLPKILDVERFLRNLAVEAITCTSDSYSTAYHNYYMYVNPISKLFEFIPYDYTFGFQRKSWSHPRFADWANVEVLSWSRYEWNGEERMTPITSNILANPVFMRIYREKLQDVLRHVFSPTSPLLQRISQYQTLLFPQIRAELYNRVYMDVNRHHRTNPIVKDEWTWFNQMESMKKFIIERYANVVKEIN